MNCYRIFHRSLLVLGALGLALTTPGCTGVEPTDPDDPPDPSDPPAPLDMLAFVQDGKIYTMWPDGSHIVQVRPGAAATEAEWYPKWSPDGTQIAFTRYVPNRGTDLSVMSADGSSVATIFDVPITDDPEQAGKVRGTPFNPTWAPDGHAMAFASNHEAFVVVETAHSYRPTRLYVKRFATQEVVAINPVRDSMMLPEWYPAWSPDGTRIAFSSYRAYPYLFAPGANDDIYLMNPDGTGVVRLTNHPDFERWPAWSPDGRRLAFERRPAPPGRTDIWIMDADGSNAVRLTDGIGNSLQPAWSPDGTRIAFVNDRYGQPVDCPTCPTMDLFMVNVDGTALTRLTHTPLVNEIMPAWRPRGTVR